MCLVDIPTFKSERKLKISGATYCFNRLDDNTIAIGGDQ